MADSRFCPPDGLSEQLRLGTLKAVWHGSPEVGTLKELVRCYDNLVDDSTRVMLRLKAIYRVGPLLHGTSKGRALNMR
jgi:hypothetical protein